MHAHIGINKATHIPLGLLITSIFPGIKNGIKDWDKEKDELEKNAMSNIEKKEMENVYNYYKDKYRVDWVPNEDFDYEGDPKYYEESPRLIIYFSKTKDYAILADVDEVVFLKKWLDLKRKNGFQ